MRNYSNNIKKKNISIPILLFRIISIIIILICLYRLYNWYLENKENNQIIDNILAEVDLPEDNNIIVEFENNTMTPNATITKSEKLDFTSLSSQNSDTVAWIKINNTEANFPVVQTTNNNYYINHNFKKQYNSAGWIFADYRNKFDGTDKNIIIYGHNRRDGSMFSSLNNILSENWYTNQDNHIVKLYTPSETQKYQIFSIYKIHQSKFDNSIEFADDEQYQNYINTCINNSIFNFNEDVTTADKILTVYTCANNNQYRIILQAKLIEN